MAEALSGICAYPDPECEQLREKLAEHFGWEKRQILCGNGASELIQAICRWRNFSSALLLAPGFSGYERALRSVGSEISYYFLDRSREFRLSWQSVEELLYKLRTERPELLFLANPSNPVGAVLTKDVLIMIAEACQETGTIFVLDECFMELTEDPSKATMTGELGNFPMLMILRAFTKSFAIPGIRLGYLLCGEGILAKGLEDQLTEWNVSLPAQYAGIAAMDQEEYLQKSRELIRKEREFLSRELENLGARTFPSEANFILFRWRNGKLYEQLLQQGILIRDCRDYVGLSEEYCRVAVKGHPENLELLRAIRQVR